MKFVSILGCLITEEDMDGSKILAAMQNTMPAPSPCRGFHVKPVYPDLARAVACTFKPSLWPDSQAHAVNWECISSTSTHGPGGPEPLEQPLTVDSVHPVCRSASASHKTECPLHSLEAGVILPARRYRKQF